MNSLAEKLVESWLDSQTERRYQPAFIQMLVADGWTVLHNTRHSPIEFGKDVIARSPDGILHCFQLKGNPGTRLRKSEAQLILPQITELITAEIPRIYLKAGTEKFIAVLVTNGEVDEEANLLLTLSTNSVEQGTLPARAFFIWSRGILLSQMVKSLASVWPATVEGIRTILNLNASDGMATAKAVDVASALKSAQDSIASVKNEAARISAVTSILLLLEIMKEPWRQRNNHYSLFLISIVGIVHCLPLAKSTKVKALLQDYGHVAQCHALDLVAYAQEQSYDPNYAWGQRDQFSEIDFQSERRRLIADCAAAITLAKAETTIEISNYLARLITVSVEKPVFWGFGSVPTFIARWWALNRVAVGLNSEAALARSLWALLRVSDRRETGSRGLPAPYYSFEECWPWWREEKRIGSPRIFSDSFRSRVWFGHPMLFMLAKRNLKQTCKLIWPDFSRVSHEQADLPPQTFFSPELADEGKMATETLYAKEWGSLVIEAVSADNAPFLDGYEDFDWVIAAYISIVPYRAWTSVLMWLDSQLNKTWYHKDCIPT